MSTSQRGGTRYVYKPDDKHPYEWITCRECGTRALVRAHGKGFCSTRCAQSGANNSVWKGDDAGYLAKHQRQYRTSGRASACVFGCTEGPFEWASLVVIDDFMGLCVSCHRKFDAAIRLVQPRLCGRSLHDISSNSACYTKIRDGKEVRQCKECAKMRAALRRGQ